MRLLRECDVGCRSHGIAEWKSRKEISFCGAYIGEDKSRSTSRQMTSRQAMKQAGVNVRFERRRNVAKSVARSPRRSPLDDGHQWPQRSGNQVAGLLRVQQ